eukprot:2647489-Rhodomonas_salina.3
MSAPGLVIGSVTTCTNHRRSRHFGASSVGCARAEPHLSVRFPNVKVDQRFEHIVERQQRGHSDFNRRVVARGAVREQRHRNLDRRHVSARNHSTQILSGAREGPDQVVVELAGRLVGVEIVAHHVLDARVPLAGALEQHARVARLF